MTTTETDGLAPARDAALERACGLDEARRALAADYLPLADTLSLPARLALPAHAEDLRGAAALALVECAARWDADSGVRFPTYAIPRIKWAVIDAQREIGKGGVTGVAPARAPRRAPIEAAGAALQAHSPTRTVDDADAFDRLLAMIPAKHAAFLHLVFGTGMSRSEAANRLKISHTWAHVLYRDGLAWLRREIESLPQYAPAAPRDLAAAG